jgi:hypothetical protein
VSSNFIKNIVFALFITSAIGIPFLL